MGAQLLAQVAGGRIRADAPAAKGWTPLRLTDAGEGDPLIGALPRFLHVFHWHDVSFAGGPTSTLLASSDTAEEAIHVAPSAWGVQFHPCLDLPVAAAWIEMEREELQQLDVESEQLRQETVIRMREYEAYGPQLPTAWQTSWTVSRRSGRRPSRRDRRFVVEDRGTRPALRC
jgi:GMP synthase (glutamine-hydrolysing)